MSKEGQFKLTMHMGWENKMFSTLEAGALVAETTEKIRINAVAGAPRSRTANTNWNQIRKNLSAFIERDARGHYGNVTIELNEKVRHALLQERGWTDRGGRKHPGRKYLKEALLKARIE
ncbi:hypothetical protein ACIQHZ_31500 [Streptomyces halstedii]|uniref:hypothetical protein n=1 Tax=Streptomyces halstedii TaxID=1944 RepID=UPI0038087B52